MTARPAPRPAARSAAAVVRGSSGPRALGELEELLAEQKRDGGEHQHDAQHRGDQLRGTVAIGRARRRAGRASPRRRARCPRPSPVIRQSRSVRRRAPPCRRPWCRGVEQVGAHRRGGMDAEQQDQQRRHQRTAATPVSPPARRPRSRTPYRASSGCAGNPRSSFPRRCCQNRQAPLRHQVEARKVGDERPTHDMDRHTAPPSLPD